MISLMCGISKIQQTSEYNKKRSRVALTEDNLEITSGEHGGEARKTVVDSERCKRLNLGRDTRIYCTTQDI